MKLLKYLMGALVALSLAAPAQAQTTDEIVSRGTINIGILTDLPPYGYLDENQKPVGFDVDVANMLGKFMGVKVNLVSVTGPNRIPFLVSGKVDLLVATFGITPERAKTVTFSIPYSAGSDDLKGKRVGVPRGAVQDVLLTNALGTTAKIQRFDDDASTYQALIAGQVDAIAETGLTGRQLYAKTPELKLGEAFILLRQPNGITMRKDQFNLRQWVDTFIYYVKVDGELAATWTKWFKTDFPVLPVF